MAKYKIIPSSRTIVRSPISIGHKAEKGVQAIEFDLTAWVEMYGSGTATVNMRRWGDAIPYPIALEIDENNKATWTLSDTDTAKAGMAYAQLSYIVGDEVVKKSDIYTFRVMDSLTGEGEPPEAYDSWLEHLTHLAAEAMAEVLDIEGIVTDKTLAVNGGIADAKAAGDALALKADKSTTYTKTEVDQMIEDVEVETDTTLSVSGKPADAAETGRQIDLLKADLGAYSFNTPVSYKDFVKGYQLQTYHVGYKITIKADTTGQRAVTTTPIYFPRKIFLSAPNGYEFFLCVVTSKTDFTVLVENPSYFTHDWIQARSYIMLQVRRKDKAVLTDADMEIINSWIDFQYKIFESDYLKRLCALKKQFYSGSGHSYSNTHDLFLMVHITDVHSDVQRYANFRQFVDDNASVINCAICTGDYVDNQTDEQWTAMNNVSGNVDVLQAVGNHDAGHQAGDTLIGDTDLVTKFGIETNTGKMYYYVDYDTIRVIVLNQFEGSTKGTYVYNSDEITWLLSVLDDSIANSKHVIIACHLPDTFPVANNKEFYQRYNKGYPQYPTMNSGLEEVINAFKHGTSVTTTLSGNISVSHTFASAGDFVCWICGHYHGDFIGYSSMHSDQLYLNGNCGVCQPAPFKYTFMGETFSDLARIPKTPSEDCFNVYAFDFKERVVKVAKIGADINDILQPRQMAVYSMDGE